MIATAKAPIVNTNWTLLKFSLSTSKVPDGAVRVRKRSRPYAKMREVDSKRAGAVTIRLMLAT